MSVGTTEADHFYLDRQGQKELINILRSVTALMAGLDAAICCQERFSEGGPRTGKVERSYPLPFNPAASAAATALHQELASWVRFVCEPRGITYWPIGYTHEFNFIGPLRVHDKRVPSPDFRDNTAGLALWLDRNVAALALTPGSEESLRAIRHRVRSSWAVLTPPRDRSSRPLDDEKREEARKSQVNASAAARMAKLMGRRVDEDGNDIENYLTLTKRRIFHLCEVGAVKPIRHTTIRGKESPVFVFGQLLDAHLAHPTLESA
ncbi:hypothetical protein LRQ08_21600 [Rhodococcus qingshengii]|uniref:hypothetical protein n=1 Tax=Rhodococcus qingshengii TaxID=334542 RepID=UPI0021120239|nr:hypothetical protein [Rhodococcus qingshengii]UUE23824.1 hypothetical protein LRQ08_21600 [Rhodococcus qingshengii]